MPGQTSEASAIFHWLANELSPDTWVNIMGQYRPDYEVGEVSKFGKVQYTEIDRLPEGEEMRAAYAAAKKAGLWRFDERLPRRGLMLLRR